MSNATDLFIKPSREYHSSESSWSSLFAYQIIDACHRGVRLGIPTFVYREDEDLWYFEQQNEPLLLPPQLDFTSIIIEGKLCTGCVQGIPDPLPMEFNDLRPDITLLWDGCLTVIETKTVGARITQKDQLYFDLCSWFAKRGINAKAYLLLSAGHEPDSDVRSLAGAQWRQAPKLILWEQFFKAVEKQVRDSLLSRLVPNLRQYYEPEADYLSGLTWI